MLIASKSLQIKKKLVIHIEMNPYIEIKPIYEKEYGSNIVYNIIKNLGEKINHLSLKLPIQIDYEGIYEQIINS